MVIEIFKSLFVWIFDHIPLQFLFVFSNLICLKTTTLLDIVLEIRLFGLERSNDISKESEKCTGKSEIDTLQAESLVFLEY